MEYLYIRFLHWKRWFFQWRNLRDFPLETKVFLTENFGRKLGVFGYYYFEYNSHDE